MIFLPKILKLIFASREICLAKLNWTAVENILKCDFVELIGTFNVWLHYEQVVLLDNSPVVSVSDAFVEVQLKTPSGLVLAGIESSFFRVDIFSYLYLYKTYSVTCTVLACACAVRVTTHLIASRMASLEIYRDTDINGPSEREDCQQLSKDCRPCILTADEMNDQSLNKV